MNIKIKNAEVHPHLIKRWKRHFNTLKKPLAKAIIGVLKKKKRTKHELCRMLNKQRIDYVIHQLKRMGCIVKHKDYYVLQKWRYKEITTVAENLGGIDRAADMTSCLARNYAILVLQAAEYCESIDGLCFSLRLNYASTHNLIQDLTKNGFLIKTKTWKVTLKVNEKLLNYFTIKLKEL